MGSGSRTRTEGGWGLPATRRRRATILRCECSNCGIHFHVEARLVVTGGNCPNCGSYRYEPICVEPRGPLNPWTWRPS